MKVILKLLILLGIMSALRLESATVPMINSSIKANPVIKGPVYNPLRQKPYSKYSVKA